MSQRSHDARHRAVDQATPSATHQATSKPRLLAGLALPTAATLVLMFGATGAAVATSPKTQTVAAGQSTALTSQNPTAAQQAAMKASHLNAVEKDLAVVRATAVSRGVARQKIAERAAQVKREALAAKQAAKAKQEAKDKREAKAKRAAQAKSEAQAVHGWQLPVKNAPTTSGFGYRWGRLHAGEDFAVSEGTPLGAMSAGKVSFAGEQSGFGNIVQIRYWDGTESYYGHMSSISVNVGETVTRGQIVGQSGNTGHSTGPHLHLEIHPAGGEPIDPLPWLADHNIAP